ncbi:hypothetical protein DV738_g1472, partial [Chaetothyriales sp. CBS 135597]
MRNACYIPSAINNYLPSAVACPPPPTFFSRTYDAIISPISSTYSTVRAILGTLIGLPFLSSVALLTHGGWSTTANILFFYITWSTLVLSHPPLRVELIGSLAVRLVFYVIPSLLFLAFDAHAAVRVTTTLPAPITILKNIVQGYAIREVFTYAIHRLQWYHTAIAAPFPLSASYDHPLPYLLLRFLPAYLPTLLLRFHLITYLVFLLLVSVEETFAHSGYCCSSAGSVLSPVHVVFFFLLGGGVARHADLHAVAQGQGNYGCVGLVDWIMGTGLDSVGSEWEEWWCAEAAAEEE